MNPLPPVTPRSHACGTLALALFALGATGCPQTATPSVTPSAPAPRLLMEATSEQVHQLCGACHVYPPPDSLPRSSWRKEVAQGFDFLRGSNLSLKTPPPESVVQYYEKRAPVELPLPAPTYATTPLPVRFERHGYRASQPSPHPAVAHVNLVHLSEACKLDLLVCDMRFKQLLLLKPYEPQPHFEVLAELPHPAHTEVVDLDGDGLKDILVANLGNFRPTDLKVGSVVWLKGSPDGKFAPIPLLQGVGRVADVQPADVNGDGKLDLIVAVFGWRSTGDIIYLENRTSDWSRPVFVPQVVDDRHGAIHVPVGDLNGDGRPDFVALISQEHETVVAFLNEGSGRFRKETIYTAPHPMYGSSGIQLVDLDGDGDRDLLYTNGDMEPPLLLLPYHGVHWLENRGTFPWVPHPLAALCGAHRALAADLDSDGDRDIVAVSLLPAEGFAQRRQDQQLDAVLLLEQTAPGQFVRHALEKITCDHATVAVGDIFGDGRMHLVTGNFCMSTSDKHTLTATVTIWHNLGPSAKSPPPSGKGSDRRNPR
ncbi:MAG: FG-GAP-like repeat-containing protein [Gemmataceae bacterium]|nr:FG-GAP-like repeat-containing protein [Gemmataceae bacterium]